jgi:hypothetical protein
MRSLVLSGPEPQELSTLRGVGPNKILTVLTVGAHAVTAGNRLFGGLYW